MLSPRARGASSHDVRCAFFVQLLDDSFVRHSNVQHWETVVGFMRQHSLVRNECIAVGTAVTLLWLKAVNLGALRRRIGAAADSRLTGDLSTAPPPVTGYTHYIPCALYVAPASPRRRERGAFELAPGVLYIGPEGISFQPRVTGVPHGTPSVPPFNIGPDPRGDGDRCPCDAGASSMRSLAAATRCTCAGAEVPRSFASRHSARRCRTCTRGWTS